MFIHWISYLCSTRGNIYADDWRLCLTALLQPPPGNTEGGLNKGPQQRNHETDKTATNWHSHGKNTQWYLLSAPTSSRTSIMIHIWSDISNGLVLQLQPPVKPQIARGRIHAFIPSDLTKQPAREVSLSLPTVLSGFKVLYSKQWLIRKANDRGGHYLELLRCLHFMVLL